MKQINNYSNIKNVIIKIQYIKKILMIRHLNKVLLNIHKIKYFTQCIYTMIQILYHNKWIIIQINQMVDKFYKKLNKNY